jgi:mannose-1-phosphate guanylyltransferase / mannose-6-phosphate isomerase
MTNYLNSPPYSRSRDTKIRAIVLAGGVGSRLWPLSTPNLPKQFLRLFGNETLLEATISRLRPLVDTDSITIVTSEASMSGASAEYLKPYNTILEPVMRGTAPAIGFAALEASNGASDPTLVILPSDHNIRNADHFRHILEAADHAVCCDPTRIICLGVTPHYPETGYGYIKVSSQALNIGNEASTIQPVASFTEKPSQEVATKLLMEGGYFWNCGILIAKASTLLRAIDLYLPKLSVSIHRARNLIADGLSFQDAMTVCFPHAENVSIDHGVLEKICAGNGSSNPKLMLIPADFGWSDIGSWDAYHDASTKDTNGNMLRGNVIAVDTTNCTIVSTSRNVAVLGMTDVIVIESVNAILVTKRGRAQDVRQLANMSDIMVNN